ncbi:unnamed protein product [marine sediment metagenome]|uniref:Uncharacterized protein n=1 Tax=marine sediment metagenome TaxID=412755 RepID=X1H942_9ZZZZ
MFFFFKERLEIFTKIGDSIYNVFILGKDVGRNPFESRLEMYRYLLISYTDKPIFGYGLGSAYKLNPY